MQYRLQENEWGDKPHQPGKWSIMSNFIESGSDTEHWVSMLDSGTGPLELFFANNFSTGLTRHPINGNFELLKRPLGPRGLSLINPLELKDHLRRSAGAHPDTRSTVDKKIIKSVIFGNGRIIDSEQEAGGYPQMEPVYREIPDENIADLVR